MKKIICSLVLLCFLFSCSDDEIIFNTQDDIKKSTRAAGDGKWDLLGYGYNCFYSDFKDPVYTKARVLDLDRLQSGRGRNQITGEEITFNSSEIIEAELHGNTKSLETYGSSIDKFTKDIKINASGGVDLKLFKLDIEAKINSSSTTYKENAFYRIDALKLTRRLTLPYTTPSRLKYFLSDEFLADLRSLSGHDIIEKYGTHVMTDILLGGNFSGFYTGTCNEQSEKDELDFRTSAKYLMVSVKGGVNYQTDLFQNFKNVNILIQTKGGTKAITSTISQNSNGKLDNVDFDYRGWIDSVTKESESLIGIGNPDTRIYSISEFIDDPNKRKDIEFAMYLKKQSTFKILVSGCGKGMLAILKDNKVGLGPILQQHFNRASINITNENNYYKFEKSNNQIGNNTFLNNSLAFTSNKNDNSQKWIFHFNDYNNFKLQNLYTGLFLSSYDLTYHASIPVGEESKFHWSIISPNF